MMIISARTDMGQGRSSFLKFFLSGPLKLGESKSHLRIVSKLGFLGPTAEDSDSVGVSGS